MEQKSKFEHQLDPEGYYFSHSEPQAPNRAERRFFWGEDGHIHVKSLSAFWIPELTVTEAIHGTTYVVTGSYEGTENFVRKLERITSKKFAEKMEDSEEPTNPVLTVAPQRRIQRCTEQQKK